MFPTRSEYIDAVKKFQQSVQIPILKNGKYQPGLMKAPKVFSGGFSVVFPIDCGSKTYGLRCWINKIPNAKFKYKEIQKFIRQYPKYFIKHLEYNENGIKVGGKMYDTVTMSWEQGDDLKQYISKNINNRYALEKLRSNFLEMFGYFHRLKVAHSDYQEGNFIIKPDGNIVVIDYDGLYIPSFQGKQLRDCINGLEGYQSPVRGKNQFLNHKVDYFSELIIYLSLSAFIARPSLWKKYKVEESTNRLLFTKEDFLNPRSSNVFQELERISELQKEVKWLKKYLTFSSINQMVPLEKLWTSPAFNTAYRNNGYRNTQNYGRQQRPFPITKSISDVIINDFTSKMTRR